MYERERQLSSRGLSVLSATVCSVVAASVFIVLVSSLNADLVASLLLGSGCGLIAAALVHLVVRPMRPGPVHLDLTGDRLEAVRRAVRRGRPDEVDPRDDAGALVYARRVETFQFRAVRVITMLAVAVLALAVGGLTFGQPDPILGSIEFTVVILWPMLFIPAAVAYAVLKRNRRRFFERA
ncbi:MAG: hypothetical protein RI885_88 [Actinomycetota bacterium]|jgi:hypothetical protein